MSDKDQFPFEDNGSTEEKPEVSDAVSESGEPVEDTQLESGSTDYANTEEQSEPSSSGTESSKTRVLLVVLLFAVIGAGAYYYIGMDTSSPSVPTAPEPIKKTQKAVSLPPPSSVNSASTPAPRVEPSRPETASTTTPSPKASEQPPGTQSETVSSSTPASVDKVADTPKQEMASQPDQESIEKAPDPSTPSTAVNQTQGASQKKPQEQQVTTPAVSSEKPTKLASVAPQQVTGPSYTLDAGSFLFESNRDALIAKIKGLGYEPVVTPVDANLNMTRLRLGTYRKDEVKKALETARSIEPGSYSAPAGDGYVIYAGTFLKKDTVNTLKSRFSAKGINVHAEPVQVVRTLSRIRFGEFGTKTEAQEAADKIKKSGVKTEVVKIN